jgi:hypothetical protein
VRGCCPIQAVELLPENQLSVDVYNKTEALGAELVFRLYNLHLTPIEAEELLEKLEVIAHTVHEVTKQIDKNK